MRLGLLLIVFLFACVVQCKNYGVDHVPQKFLTMITAYDTANLNLPAVEVLKAQIAANSGITRISIRDAVKEMMDNGINL